MSLSENSRIWARDTIAQLSATLSAFSVHVEPVDVGARGSALAARIDDKYFLTIFAAESEGPTRVVISTGILRNVDLDRYWDALAAANMFHRTRAQGRVVLSNNSSAATITLQMTMGPAILNNVPQFAQVTLGAFAAEARIARKFLAEKGIKGDRYSWETGADLELLMHAIDDQTDLLLDFDDLMQGE